MSKTADPDKYSLLFMGLVTSFQQNALIALGKISNPLSGKVERDLKTAAALIDMLDMLMEKTKGNLRAEEAQMLEQILSHIKLNYVEETDKAEPEPSEEGQGEKSSEGTSEPKASTSDTGSEEGN